MRKILSFLSWKVLIFSLFLLHKFGCNLHRENYQFSSRKQEFIHHSWSDKGLMGIDVNQTYAYSPFKEPLTFRIRGVFRNLSRGGLKFFFQGGGSAPVGHENPLKSIDFTGQGGGLSPNSPPLNTPLFRM